MILAISFAAMLTLTAITVACMTDWLMAVTAPCRNDAFKPDEAANICSVSRKNLDRVRQLRRIRFNRSNPNLRHQIETRELPFLC